MQRTPAIAIGAVLVAVVAILAFLLMNRTPPTGDASPSASPSTSVTASASAGPSLAADLLDRRWTVLFAGLDVNEGRAADGLPENTDALVLVSLSADASTLTLVSLPRDTVDLPLPDGGSDPQKINALYRAEGIDGLVGALETLYGIPIDGHVLIDMDDFAALIDAVDGVDVNPPQAIDDTTHGLDIHFDAGPQELDGADALLFVRTRVDKDYGRMARQQEVIRSLVERLVDPDSAIDLSALLDGLDSVDTDLPVDELPTLVELARRATSAEVQSLVIGPPLITFEGDRNDGRGYVLEPDVDAIRAAVQELIAD
jgi:LCP family protein required for cell wall assembly